MGQTVVTTLVKKLQGALTGELCPYQRSLTWLSGVLVTGSEQGRRG